MKPPRITDEEMTLLEAAGRAEKPPRLTDAQMTQHELASDPFFANLPPAAKTQYVQTKVHGREPVETPEEAAARAGAGPRKFMEGAAGFTKDAASGLLDMGRKVGGAMQLLVPGRTREGLDDAYDLVMGVVNPQVEQFHQAQAEAGRGNMLGAGGHALASALPMVGPMAADLGEAVGRDPWEGAGRVAGAALQIPMGEMAARGGARMADAGRPLPAGPFPGLEATGIEGSKGMFGGLARGSATSPMGQRPVARFLEGRNAAVRSAADDLLDQAGPAPAQDVPFPTVKMNAEAEAAQLLEQANAQDAAYKAQRDAAHEAEVARLTEGAEREKTGVRARSEAESRNAAADELMRLGGQTGERAGQDIAGAVLEHKGAVRGVEGRVWEGLKTGTKERGVRAPLTQTTENGMRAFRVSKEAQDALLADLDAPTQAVISRIVRGAEGDTAMRALNSPEYSGLSPEAREAAIAQLTDASQGAPDWNAVHEARSRVGDLLDAAKRRTMLPDRDVYVLRQVYDGLTADLKGALADFPDLAERFEVGAGVTRAKHDLFGTEGTVTADIARAKPKIKASQIPAAATRTPESMRNLARAVGEHPTGKPALRSGAMGEVFEKARSTETVGAEARINFKRALNELDTNPAYREALGNEYDAVRGRVEARAAQPEPTVPEPTIPDKPGTPTVRMRTEREEGPAQVRIEVEAGKGPQVSVEPTKRRALEDVFSKASGGRYGAPDAKFDGPAFATAYQKARESLRAQGFTPGQIAGLDQFAAAVGKHTLKQSTSKLASLADKGIIIGVATSAGGLLASGHPGAAAAAATVGAASLLGERALVRVFLHPDGPNILARAMRADRYGREAGKLAKYLSKIAAANVVDRKAR